MKAAVVLSLIAVLILGPIVFRLMQRAGVKSPAGKPGWRRKAVVIVVVATVGVLVWRWLMTVGSSNPQLGLGVALVLMIVSFFVSKVKGFGFWLPFAWLIAACLFARVSVNSSLISQPGSILAMFGIGKWLIYLTVACVVGTIIMAMIEQNKFTWLVVVAALCYFVAPAWYRLARYSGQLESLSLSGGVRNEFGKAALENGIVTVNATSQARDNTYRVMSEHAGYRGETYVHNGDAVEVWLDSNTPMPHPETLELYIGSLGLGGGWVRPFDGGDKKFTGRAKNCWLELRLPAGATGKYQFRMKILEENRRP